MTRDDWLHDLRAVDEVVIEAGEKMQDGKLRRFWWIVYSLAVAVWHLLDDKIKEKDRKRTEGGSV